MLRFDAYTATTSAAKAHDLERLLADVVPFDSGVEIKQGRGFHTFAERLSFKGSDGGEFAAISWGGKQDDRAMLEVKGEHTPAAVEALRTRFPHRCTRVDSCADFDALRAFERLYRACRRVKTAHRIMGGKAGDWEDFPEKGRTLYIGSTHSPTRMRLYEKGKQAEYLHLERPNWTRLEVQVRPAKEAKSAFSRLTPEEVWGASRWTRDIAALVLQQHVDPHPAGSTYRKSEDERTIAWMCKQYGPTLLRMREDLGSWGNVGRTLGEVHAEQQRRKD